MKKLYFLFLFIIVSTVTFSQTTLIDENFESGYANDTSIDGVNGWTKQETGMVVKTVNSTGNGHNNSDWYAEFTTGAFTVLSKNAEVVAGEEYTFTFYSYKTGAGATRVKILRASDETEFLLGPTSGTADTWVERKETFTATASEILRFQAVQNWGSGTIKIDNFSVVCNTCETASSKDYQAFEFSMYPNPTRESINISSTITLKNLKVFNLLGKEVLHIENPANNVNVSSLNNGVYIVKLESTEGAIVSKKLVIK